MVRLARNRPAGRLAAALTVGGFLAAVVGGGIWVLSRQRVEPGPAAHPAATGSLVQGECANKSGIQTDVDGDGSEDVVYHEWVGDGPVLGVCTASGRKDRIEGKGQAELLFVVDVERDGRDEILYGGTSAVAQLASIAVFTQEGLEEVLLSDGKPLVVVNGIVANVSEEGGPPTDLAWGCEDTDGDGQPELVQVTVKPADGSLDWTREAFRIEGASASLVSTESGRMEGPDEGVGVARTLTSPCEVMAPA
jgi:hypothetical protein